MSGGAPGGKGALARLVQAIALASIFALLFAATRATPAFHGAAGTIAAIGFLLLAGTLASELLDALGVPHLTGYLLAGILAGPHALQLIDHESVEQLSSVNTLALALIAMAGGAELDLESVRKGLKSLVFATAVQTVVIAVGMVAVFMAARPLIPFARPLALGALFGVALLWSVLAMSRSPSATLGILAQTRAQGPLARWTLTFVMSSDVVVVVLLAAAITVSRPLIEPGATLSAKAFEVLGHEIVGSVSLGTTLGLLLAVYLRVVGKGLPIVFVALGFGFTEILRYLHFDPLLTFLVAGFVVQNLSKQGKTFLHAIERMGGVVYVIFFASAGAHLDLPLLGKMWPVALLLASSRAGLSWGASRLSARLARDGEAVKKWSFSGLVSQAGLTIGLSGTIEHEFPIFGAGFRALVLATVALNEMIGPIVFKLAIDKAGESRPAERTSLLPEAPHAPHESPRAEPAEHVG
jgi:Kef-type K+ transport system membrane component KefB